MKIIEYGVVELDSSTQKETDGGCATILGCAVMFGFGVVVAAAVVYGAYLLIKD